MPYTRGYSFGPGPTDVSRLSGWVLRSLLAFALLHAVAWMIAPLGGLSHAEERPKAVGRLAAVEGDVWILHEWETEYREALLNDEIFEADRLSTGKDGKARILFQDDSMVALGTNSELAVAQFEHTKEKTGREALVDLLRGKIRFQVVRFFTEGKVDFRIRSASAVVGVRGTEGVLRVQNPTLAYCLSGILLVENPSTGEALDLGPMRKALVEKDRPIVVDTISPAEADALMREFEMRSSPEGRPRQKDDTPREGSGPRDGGSGTPASASDLIRRFTDREQRRSEEVTTRTQGGYVPGPQGQVPGDTGSAAPSSDQPGQRTDQGRPPQEQRKPPQSGVKSQPSSGAGTAPQGPVAAGFRCRTSNDCWSHYKSDGYFCNARTGACVKCPPGQHGRKDGAPACHAE